MAAETQFTANTGMTTISTANTSLTGSGTLNTDIWSVITGASNGTKVKSLWIKSVGSTSAEGMIRFFINDGAGNTKLLAEVVVPFVTQSAQDVCFEKYIDMDLDLKSGYSIYATTEKSDTFNIFAEGLNWTYYSASVRTDTTTYTANTGLGTVSTGNSNLDGTGAGVLTVLTSGASGSGWKGCRINSIKIKATGNPTDGIIRLFIDSGSVKKLLKEVPVNAITHSAKTQSYAFEILFNGSFQLQAGYRLLITTQNSQNFTVTVDAEDWTYIS